MLIALTAFFAYAQQYDPESDFEAMRERKAITIAKYVGRRTVVNIPPRIQNLPVTNIGYGAFADYSSLTSVTIPDSVNAIRDLAFDGCKRLTSVTIGKSVASIGDRAFAGCASLTSVTFGNGVTSIGELAFDGCKSLTSITIPGSITSIGRDAFTATGLTSVTFQGMITSKGFSSIDPFPGDLLDKYLAGGPGTYTRTRGKERWTKSK